MAIPHSLWLAMGDLAVHGTSGHGTPCDSQLSWLPVVTFGYQCYQVLQYSMLYTWSIVNIVTYLVVAYDYLWLPALPGIVYCGYSGVLLLQLPGSYQVLSALFGIISVDTQHSCVT